MQRIYIKYTIPDPRANKKKQQFEALGLKSKLGEVCLNDCYTIDSKLNKTQIQKAFALLANPQIQNASTKPQADKFNYAIEIGFLPGVTDNVAHTAKETLIDGAHINFKPGQNVYSSQVFFISGRLSQSDINKIAASLYNPLIQKATITSYQNFKKHGLAAEIPTVKISASNKVINVDLNVSDKELIKLGKLGIFNDGIRQGPLALSLHELKAIQNHFKKLKRKPTDVELEMLAQTWSEHCKHTIFSDPMDEIKDGIFKHYIKRATDIIRKQKAEAPPLARGRPSAGDFCVSVFKDNAGGISFDDDYVIAYKVETHNTPSALDPFGGSLTGITGVNRDALGFGLGSKPVANFYGFCLADPNNETKLYRDKKLKNPMLSARRIMDGVIAGINSGGNQSGIPTPLGFLFFNGRFRGKPLVFAGTLGLLPKKIGARKAYEKKAMAGDYIVSIGGKVGLDGIHGATFSSEGLDTHSPATAVQIGDPITQKKFIDAICKEAREMNLYNSITDCGAGGLSSAVGEMAKEAGGCLVWLDKVPLKYPGLAPWQIWISESQERMALAVPKAKWKKFEKLMKVRGVEATVIGEFVRSGKCKVTYGGKTVLDMNMEFLHNGRPKKQLTTRNSQPVTRKQKIENKKDYSADVLKLLSDLNITSTEFVNTQYDHEVQGTSVLKPLQGKGRVNSEAAVIRPVLDSNKGVVLSYGLDPMLSEINPYAMAAASLDAAVRAAVAAGGNIDHLAILDNFCWCSPNKGERLWQLKEAARACFDVATAYGTPFISGKDSMHNDFKGFDEKGKSIKVSIPPTLLITAVGVMPDIEKSVSLDFKMPGDVLYILGQGPTRAKAGVHILNTAKNLRLYRAVYKAMQQNLVASAISVNRGGLAIALAKSAIGGGIGLEADVKNLDVFSESTGRILVSVAPHNVDKFEKLMKGNISARIGSVTEKTSLIINSKGKSIVKLDLKKAEEKYKSTFRNY